ncbi:hypothetical protein [Streptomyces sp. NPDC005303]|uniref:hypothetical protein n=1 Tax=Streptomyces sp. NPDC005303 TaxID=3155713 RepID=UPI0033AD73FC
MIVTWTPISIKVQHGESALFGHSQPLHHARWSTFRCAATATARELPEDGKHQLDLVLLHLSLQFVPSQWKEVRGRLGPGRPQTVTLPGPGDTGGAVIDHEARHYRENGTCSTSISTPRPCS